MTTATDLTVTSPSLRFSDVATTPGLHCMTVLRVTVPPEFSRHGKSCIEYNTITLPDGIGGHISQADYLQEWEQLCYRLAKCLSPYQLRLALTISNPNFEFIASMLQPLLSLPPLNSCDISLPGWKFDSRLCFMSTTLLRVTGQIGFDGTQFPFTRLPHELQLLVLEQSDLVLPNRDIVWSAKYRLQHFACCLRHYQGRKPHGVGSDSPFLYSSTSPCWSPPRALFQVSREMRAQALHIFHSKNTFAFNPYYLNIDTELLHCPSDSFQSFRYIKFHLPAACIGLLQPNWKGVLEIIALTMDLAKLTIEVNIGLSKRSHLRYVQSLNSEDGAPDPTPHWWSVCEQVMAPFMKLKEMGLRKLMVNVHWPCVLGEAAVLTVRASVLEKKTMGHEYNGLGVAIPWRNNLGSQYCF
ncbi:predicted protein [Uncinocarpus reesii 1704]|uniref:F-box domain-containing protein n=1 Tax=Uncinocarpus reesii (strain UAMH 1704) TaxID=336963 RepID=C4JZP4_UNCRE|nr:uncharacterized protein UREG_07645 [Uncinocarpus reesii 1704]EEP82780.1 predicted protein [Uncinocarpus reesii 1704]